MPGTVACLDAAALRRLLAGQFAAAEASALAAHLEGCPRCVQYVRALSADLLEEVVRAARRPPAAGAPGVSALLDRLLKLRSPVETVNRAAPDAGTWGDARP